MKKVVLISIDGMRPDGFLRCGNPFVQDMMRLGSYTLDGRTVFPSITLPCHMSLFHSVPPERHGTMGNIHMPMVRPVTSLFQLLARAGCVNAMYYGWEELRDVSSPGCLKYAEFIHSYSEENTDGILTDCALRRMESNKPDFVFLYMVETDEKGGHDCGWMSKEYLKRISQAIDNVKRVWEKFHDEYTILVTADHGGHERIHGTDLPEDMTIPMFCIGPDFVPGKVLEKASILDLAPTVTKVMGLSPDRDWEGKALF